MREWRSKLENILQAEELNFSATSGFQPFNHYFASESVAHPAKANLFLLYFLIKKHTKPQETVLDPMAGTGSTGIIASLLDRNAVCVELESKFVEWSKANVELLKKRGGKKGEVKVLQGDARRLSQILKEADVIVTSPPYSENKLIEDYEFYEKQRIDNRRNANAPHILKDFTMAKNNIGNLPHGNVDAVITSPPYGEAQDGHGIAKEGYRGKKHSPTDLVGNRSYMPDKFESEQNISKLKYDAVITSPPYADAKKGGEVDDEKMAERWDKTARERNWNTWGKTWKTEGRKRALKSLGSGYSEKEENIGNLPFDAVITSPPYEESLANENPNRRKEYWKTSGGYQSGRGIENYGNQSNNIGNLKKETYLEAMLQVYREMFKVLKLDGKAMIVIKPFVRNKKVVDLPYHTWLLLEKVGFQLEKLYKLRLKQESFWRILYHKKHSNVPKISHEYVLVCRKPWACTTLSRKTTRFSMH